MPDLLLELFSEEIPARMQGRAAADLERAVNKALLDAGFMPEAVKAFAGPRRLTLAAQGLPARQPDRKEEKKGPRVGAPEKAIEGFLRSAGLSSVDQCETRADKKGEFYVAVIDEKGRETSAVIAEAMPAIIRGFPWPKSMRWGDGDLKWVRPLHSILCAFDGEVVTFDVDGIAAGDATRGHRFLAPGEIRVRNFDDYAAALKSAKVILSAEERAERIAGEAKTLCEAQGLELVEDAGLLAEVAGLAEWPVPMIGAFDEKFLALPDEVLTASMRGHQKYFSVRDPKTGRLANRFVCVANIEAPDGGAAMRAGYERVLTARLSDAWYLYHQDLKRPLADRVADLDRVTFFEGLGSIGDKARRVAALAREIAPSVGADPQLAEQAALLAKADLTTGMVYEFPELQGVMGRYYFLERSVRPILRDAPDGAPQDEESASGASAAPTSKSGPHPEEPSQSEGVAKDVQQIGDAIRDHYKPAGADDAVPTDPVSVAVALADRIDTLTAFWAIGKKPTGSSDPFALRRAALGIVDMLTTLGVRVNLEICLIAALEHLLRLKSNGRLGVFYWCSDDFEHEFEAGGRLTAAELLDFDHIAECSAEILSSGKLVRHTAVDESWRGIYRVDGLNEFFENAALSITKPLELVWSLIEFFHDRLKVYLRDKGHRHDHIDAVLQDADGALQNDLVLIVMKLEALEAFLKTDDGVNLASAYKRAANILKAEEKKGDLPGANRVDAARLVEAEEKALFTALENAEESAVKAVEDERFEDAMTALASLRAPIDAFFEKVTVNADDAALRENRLALLARFRAATATVADLSKLEG